MKRVTFGHNACVVHCNRLDPVVDWAGLAGAGLRWAAGLGCPWFGWVAGLGWAGLAFARLGWAWEAGVRWGVQPNLAKPSQAQAQPGPAQPSPKMTRNSTVNFSVLLSLLKISISTFQI